MSRSRVVAAACTVVSCALVGISQSDSTAAGPLAADSISAAAQPIGSAVDTVSRRSDPVGDTASTGAVRPQELGRLVVSRHRLADEKSGVTRIGAEEFRGLFADLPSVLEQVSGVTVQRTGGFGEYATASIRGSSPKQVVVYLDGIPLNSAAGGAVDLSKISLNTLQEITIYKGAAPLELMGDAAGGVISLSTAAGTDMINGIVELGSYGYHKAGMLARKRFGNVVNRLSVDYTDADNNYAFDYDNGTVYNLDDDSRREKDNNAYTVFTTAYANSWSIGERDHVRSMVSLSKERKEFYHKHLADTTQLANREATDVRGFVRWERHTGDRSYLGARLNGSYEHSLFSDPFGTFYIGGRREETEDLPYVSLRLEGMHALGTVLTVQGFLKGSYEAYSSENLLAPPVQDSPFARRLSAGGAIELAAQWDQLQVNVRYNHVYTRDSANFEPNHGHGRPRPQSYSMHYPNANADILWLPLRWMTVDCSIRHEYLPISLSNLYGWGENYRGNPALLSEKHTEADVGLTVGTEHLQTSLAGFVGTTRDLIEVKPVSQKVIIAQNTGDMLVSGVEWDARARFGRHVAVDNHFTYMYRLKRATGEEWDDAAAPLYFSPVENDLRLTVSIGRWRLRHTATYRSPYWKGYTKGTDRETPLPALNASLSVRLFEHVDITYRIENYLDESIEPFQHYTPLPGRMHFVVGQIRF